METCDSVIPPPSEIRTELATLLARGILRLHARRLAESCAADTPQPIATESNSRNTLANSLPSRLNSRQGHGSL